MNTHRLLVNFPLPSKKKETRTKVSGIFQSKEEKKIAKGYLDPPMTTTMTMTMTTISTIPTMMMTTMKMETSKHNKRTGQIGRAHV